METARLVVSIDPPPGCGPTKAMRRWNPQSTLGRWLSAVLLILALAGTAYTGSEVAVRFAGSPESWVVNLNLFWWIVLLLGCVIAAATLAYRTAAAFTLSYEIDRNGLYINWLGNRAVIPLDQITSLDVGTTLMRLPLLATGGVGYYWGQARDTDGRSVHLFTTRSPAHALIVHTSENSYAISPVDPESFAQDLEQRRNLGSTKPLASAIEPGRMFLYSFWNDRTVRWLLMAALICNLAMLAFLSMSYPTLPEGLALRFDATGLPVDLRPRLLTLSLPWPPLF
jgi:hypothetical protein